MNNRILNTVLVLAVLTLLVLLAFNVTTGITADSVAVLKADGMTCGSWQQADDKKVEGGFCSHLG